MINFYDDKELVNLWQTFDKLMREPRLRLYIEAYRLALCTGLREFELAAILVEHCHENYIDVPYGKGAKSRTVDIHPVCVPYYHLYLRERQQQGDRCLFPGRQGPIATRTLRKYWKQVVEDAGIRYLQPLPLHALRRTFATYMAESLSMLDLMDQMGHGSITTTNKHYRGSIAGRKFEKGPLEWLLVAEAGGRKLLEDQGVIELVAWRQKDGSV